MALSQLDAARTMAIGATLASRNDWAVTVAPEVIRSVKGGIRADGTPDYAVGLGVARGRYIATSLPEQISQPPTAQPQVL